MSPTKYCPALQMELESECPEGDGYYCEGYCPYSPQEEREEEEKPLGLGFGLGTMEGDD